MHYAFDWYLTSSFLHDVCLKETNPKQIPSYPSVMMFTKVDMTAGNQDTQAVQQRCIIYGLRDRALSQYLDLECFRRKNIKVLSFYVSSGFGENVSSQLRPLKHMSRIP